MCTICSAFRPFTPTCEYEDLATDQARITEAGDAAGNTSTLYSISVGDSFAGSLATIGDADWVAVSLVAGERYDVSLTGNTLADPFLRVHDSGGTEVASNDDISYPSNVNSALSFTASTTGTYYLSARSFADQYRGSYTMDISASTTIAPIPADLDVLAAFLTDGYWFGERHSFDTSASNVITVDLTGLTGAGQQLARWALQSWEMVADIEFAETASGAQITFDDTLDGAFASYSSLGGTTSSSEINVSTSWLGTYGTSLGSYSFQTYIHEIGHALGLGHLGDYNGGASYGRDNTFVNDSWQASVMSYFDQADNTSINASFARVVTPMMADVLAIQTLYGAAGSSSASGGATVWGEGATLDNYLGQLFRTVYDNSGEVRMADGPITLTITDVGGRDTLDLRSDITNQRIDLRPESISDVNGLIGNLSIARGTTIEVALAGTGNDTVTGNDADNRLVGGLGNDLLNGGAGADRLEGGGGQDTVSYEGSRGSLRVDLLFSEINTNLAAGDTYHSIEHLIGSQGKDNLRGTSEDNYLFGAANVDCIFGRRGDDQLVGGIGDDVLFGGPGADVLIGGIHRDRAQYSKSREDLVVDLAGTGRNTGEAVGDSFDSIEDLAGGFGADQLFGDSGANRLFGWESGDHLIGRAGDDYLNGGRGADTLEGGAGNDTLRGGRDGDTFVFNSGRDVVEEFNARAGDRVALDEALWSGARTAAQVVAQYGRIEGGNAVLDFGGVNSLTLEGLTTLNGLSAQIDFL